MADNITLNSGSGGSTLATDDISSVHYQRVKVSYGVDGSATDVSDTNPLPVDDAGGSLTVDNGGTFAVQIDGDALTALQLIDNTVATEDAASAADPVGNHVVTVRDDEVGATALTNADGDVQALRSDKFGALKVTQIPEATSEVKTAAVAASSSGDNTLVAAAGAGIKIRVLAYVLVAASAVVARFEDGAGGTALSGQMSFGANGGAVAPYNPGGWFETADNTLLNLELGGAVSVAGHIQYVEI